MSILDRSQAETSTVQALTRSSADPESRDYDLRGALVGDSWGDVVEVMGGRNCKVR